MRNIYIIISTQFLYIENVVKFSCSVAAVPFLHPNFDVATETLIHSVCGQDFLF